MYAAVLSQGNWEIRTTDTGSLQISYEGAPILAPEESEFPHLFIQEGTDIVQVQGEWTVEGGEDDTLELTHSSGAQAQMLFSTGQRNAAGKVWEHIEYVYVVKAAEGQPLAEVQDRLSFLLADTPDSFSIAMQRAVGIDEGFHYYGWQDVEPGREIIMPLLPLYSYIQPWDAHFYEGTLLVRTPHQADTTLLNGLEKTKGQRGIRYRDTWRYGPRSVITTSPIEIGLLTNAEANDWINYARTLSREINKDAGVAPPGLKPYIWLHQETFPSRISDDGKWISEAIHLEEFSDRWLEKVAALAPARLHIHNIWHNSAETDSGSQLAIQSINVAESIGGIQGLTDFIDAAHDRDLEVLAWFPAALALDSSLWENHPEWLLETIEGKPYFHGYTDIQTGDFSGGFGRYLLHALLKTHYETGLDGIWWDSYLSFPTPVNWAMEEPRGMVPDLLEITKQYRREGLQVYLEGAGPLGITAIAIDDFVMNRWPEGWERGLFDTAPLFLDRARTNEAKAWVPLALSFDLYFRLLSNRCTPAIHPDNIAADEVGRFRSLHEAFVKVEPAMERSLVDPAPGVRAWQSDDGGLLVYFTTRNASFTDPEGFSLRETFSFAAPEETSQSDSPSAGHPEAHILVFSEDSDVE